MFRDSRETIQGFPLNLDFNDQRETSDHLHLLRTCNRKKLLLQPFLSSKMKHIIKNPGGRPRKSTALSYRNSKTVKFTDGQMIHLSHRAEQAGMTVAEFIRYSALHNVIKARISPEIMKSIGDLNRLGNNLNQLLKESRKYGIQPLVAACLVAIEGINTIVKKCRSLIKTDTEEEET